MKQPTSSIPAGTQSALALATASSERCSAAPSFFRSFYNDFFARCPEAERHFANTDFEHQIQLLRHAIRLLLRFPQLPRAELSLVSRLAEHRSRRDLDIPPRLYPLFVDSLMATARHYDTEFIPAVEEAWRATLGPGIVYMQGRY
jgi:hemoglobin-like flavoprotein